MRLGQLARQLSISPDKIISYLGSRDIAIDNNNNARIDNALVDLILAEFAPGDEQVRQEIIQTNIEEVGEAPPVPGPSTESAEIPELIKAPKIELQGLRVVGKIELPEKKKPEPKPETAEQQPEPRKDRRSEHHQRRNQSPRERNNPVALAREHEEREKQRQLEEERAREKERKAAYYQKRLKPQAPTKPARLVQEQLDDSLPEPVERPKTLWGRFMRWLNT